MARISNRKRIIASEPCPAHTDLGAPRLDIYIGYTEEILKLCARIAELPSLEGDVVSLRLAIASMSVNIPHQRHFADRENSHMLTALQKRITPRLVPYFNPLYHPPRHYTRISHPPPARRRMFP